MLHRLTNSHTQTHKTHPVHYILYTDVTLDCGRGAHADRYMYETEK